MFSVSNPDSFDLWQFWLFYNDHIKASIVYVIEGFFVAQHKKLRVLLQMLWYRLRVIDEKQSFAVGLVENFKCCLWTFN